MNGAGGEGEGPRAGRRASLAGRQPGLLLNKSLPEQFQGRSQWSIGQFELHEALFKGKSSELHLATDRQSGLPVAIKFYHKKRLSPINKFQVGREIQIQTQLCHDNIIKLYAAFEDEKEVYLVQELATGGDLFQKVREFPDKKFPEQQLTAEIIRPFLDALAYLHDRGIIHRDIKPENMVLDSDDVIKLADFGLAIDMHAERPVTRAGTLDYMAPEVLICPDKDNPMENKDQDHLAYSEQVDIWAAGVLAFELLVGRPPFEQTNSRMTFEHILNMDPDFPDWVSRDARSFIKAALCKDAKSRPTARQLLNHRWLQPDVRHHRARRASSLAAAMPESPSSSIPAAAAASSAPGSESASPSRLRGGPSDSGAAAPGSPAHGLRGAPQSLSECSPSLGLRPPPGVLSDDSALAALSTSNGPPSSPQARTSVSRFASHKMRARPGELGGSDRLAGHGKGGLLSDEWASAQDKIRGAGGQSSHDDGSPPTSPSTSKYSKIFSKLWGGGSGGGGAGAGGGGKQEDASSSSELSSTMTRGGNLPLYEPVRTVPRAQASGDKHGGKERSMSQMVGREKSTVGAGGLGPGSGIVGREKSMFAAVGREKSMVSPGGLAGRDKSIVALPTNKSSPGGMQGMVGREKSLGATATRHGGGNPLTRSHPSTEALTGLGLRQQERAGAFKSGFSNPGY